MSQASVEDIIRNMESLSEEELLAIDQRLAVRLREHWDRESSAAREAAKRSGIDQVTIDQAIEHHRYGR